MGKLTAKELKEKKATINLDNVKGFNVKLRKKEKMRDAEFTTMKNGRLAVKGKGSDGTGMFRIV
jgi:hypothetical protein